MCEMVRVSYLVRQSNDILYLPLESIANVENLALERLDRV